jgi:hypothetical protein
MCYFILKSILIGKTSRVNIFFSNFSQNITHSISDGSNIPVFNRLELYRILSNYLITFTEVMSNNILSMDRRFYSIT